MCESTQVSPQKSDEHGRKTEAKVCNLFSSPKWKAKWDQRDDTVLSARPIDDTASTNDGATKSVVRKSPTSVIDSAKVRAKRESYSQVARRKGSLECSNMQPSGRLYYGIEAALLKLKEPKGHSKARRRNQNGLSSTGECRTKNLMLFWNNYKYFQNFLI